MSVEHKKFSEELLSDLVNSAEQAMLQHQVPGAVAQQAALAVANNVRQRWGGCLLYIPKGHASDLSARDLKIWEQFNGYNHKELALQHDLTEVQIYAIVKKVKRAQIKLRQVDAFDESH